MPRGGKRPGAGRKPGHTAPVRARLAGQARALRHAEITAERTMLDIGRVAFALRSSMWKDGALLPFDQWPADALALLEGFEVIVKNAAAGDGHVDTVHKVHLAKKLGALELLAKHFKLVTEKVEVEVHDVAGVLQAARNRLAKAKSETKE